MAGTEGTQRMERGALGVAGRSMRARPGGSAVQTGALASRSITPAEAKTALGTPLGTSLARGRIGNRRSGAVGCTRQCFGPATEHYSTWCFWTFRDSRLATKKPPP